MGPESDIKYGYRRVKSPTNQFAGVGKKVKKAKSSINTGICRVGEVDSDMVKGGRKW
jgi:hypothetical protein